MLTAITTTKGPGDFDDALLLISADQRVKDTHQALGHVDLSVCWAGGARVEDLSGSGLAARSGDCDPLVALVHVKHLGVHGDEELVLVRAVVAVTVNKVASLLGSEFVVGGLCVLDASRETTRQRGKVVIATGAAAKSAVAGVADARAMGRCFDESERCKEDAAECEHVG